MAIQRYYQSAQHLVRAVNKILSDRIGYSLEEDDEWEVNSMFDCYREEFDYLLEAHDIFHPVDSFTYNLRFHKLDSASDFILLFDKYKDIIQSFYELHYDSILHSLSTDEYENRLKLIITNCAKNRKYYYDNSSASITRINDNRYVFDEYYTNDFVQQLTALVGKAGIYFLYNENKQLVYIGKSIDLSSRILSSCQQKKGACYFNYSIPPKEADIHIYEMYLIAKYKPQFNKDGKSKGIPSIVIDEFPRSEITAIYKNENYAGRNI
jgi:hypothetical protein